MPISHGAPKYRARPAESTGYPAREGSGRLRAMGWAKGGWRHAVAAASVVWLAQTPACASPWTLKDHRYVNGERGVSIAEPGAGTGGWRSIDVKDTMLSFAGGDAARLSWIRQCGRGLPEPRIAARELLLAVEVQGPVEGKAVTVDGAPGWQLRAHVREKGQPAWLEAVTRVGRRCTDDFVLVAPKPVPADRAVFDAWWRSFREVPVEEPGPGGASR